MRLRVICYFDVVIHDEKASAEFARRAAERLAEDAVRLDEEWAKQNVPQVNPDIRDSGFIGFTVY